MDRRKALQNLAVITGGIITLPQWVVSCGVSETTLHHTSFTAIEQELLASVADTIIPAGNSIGALSVGVDKFLQKLFDDCYKKEDQNKIKVNLNDLEYLAKATHKKSFTTCSQAEREQLLLQLSSAENTSAKDFFDLMKSETIRGFNTSQKVMTEYLGYKVAPGHYYGCVDVNEKDHA